MPFTTITYVYSHIDGNAPRYVSKPQDITVNVNEDVTFKVEVKAYPRPHISWFVELKTIF